MAPPWSQATGAILRALAPLVGPSLSLAVVPAWHDQPLDARRDRALIELIQGSGGEVLLHGFSHRSDHVTGPVGLLTDRCNELDALALPAATARLRRGLDLLHDTLGAAPAGLVPPAWAPGPIDAAALRALGLSFLVSLRWATPAHGPRLPLATCSWDTDRAGLLAPLGEGLGRAVSWLQPAAVWHIVLHPLDLERGLLPRALNLISRLLARGLRPARWEQLWPDAPPSTHAAPPP